MLKGILALFNTGIIFNPMVLLGTLLGLLATLFLEDEQIKTLYTGYHFYLLLFLISALYIYFFKRVYYRGGVETDWNQTITAMLGHFFRLTVSFWVSLMFFGSFTFKEEEKIQESQQLQELDKLEQEIRNNQKALQENYEAIMKEYNL